MQHSGSVDMNPDIFEIEFFKKKNTNKPQQKWAYKKNERIHWFRVDRRPIQWKYAISKTPGFIWKELQKGMSCFFFAKNAVLGLGLELGLTQILTLNLTLKQHSSFVKSCLLRIFLHVGSGNYMRKSIHYNNDKKEKKKKKNFHINYLSNTKHISNFPEA